MDVEIKIKDEEAKDVILDHVLETFPEIDRATKDIDILQSYGDFTVRISDKVEAEEPEEADND